MVYNNTIDLEFKIQNVIFLLYENENHYRYLEPKLKLIKFNIKNSDVINNISMNTIQNINNINNKILIIKNYTLDNHE